MVEGNPAAAAQALAAVLPLEPQLRPLRRAALWRAQALLAQAQHQETAAVALQRKALQLTADSAGRANPRLLLLQLELAEMLATQGQPVAALQALQPLGERLAALHPAAPLAQRGRQLLKRLSAA